MSTLRISNIEAKSVPASATIDEKVKITNSSGDVLVFLDGKTSGITTVGINTTDGNITFDANSNVVVTGIITATKFVGTIEPSSLDVSTNITLGGDIIHSGDDTKIRFPANDLITFESAGNERLRITSNGQLVIGHNASHAIDIGHEFRVQVSGTNFPTSGISQQRFEDNISGASLALCHSRNGTQGSHTALQSNDEYGKIRFYGSDGTDFDGYGAAIVAHVDGAMGVNSTPGRLEFHTTASGSNNATERLCINSSGYVGVARSTPLANLHVANNELAIGENPASAAAPNATYDALVVDGSNASFINIRSRGNGSASYGRVSFSDDVRSRGYVEYRHEDGSFDDELRFATASNVRLVINKDGDMGLGTGSNTISQRLDVRESSTTVFNASSNLPTIARLYNTSATNGASAGLQLRTDNNNGAAGIQYIHAVNSSTNYDSDLVFSRRIATSGTYAEACRITNTGNLKFPNGKGIDFSATADAGSPSSASSEVFDDYEEGSWTPGLSGSSSVTGQTYTSRSGYYTKIGNRVFCDFSILIGTKGSYGGPYLQIVNLPFTVASGAYTRSCSTPIYFRTLNYRWCFLGLQQYEGQPKAFIFGVEGPGSGADGASNRSYPNGGDIANGTEFTCSFSYLAA